MGEWVAREAADGHVLRAWHAAPETGARAGLVVIQEVFGVNDHIRDVAEGFAREGYAVEAPALFDRVEPGAELAYTPDGLERGRAFRAELGWEHPLADIKAVVTALRREHAKVGAVGFCWGGSLAWLAATRLDVDCAVCYYGGQIIQFNDETPRCPVLLHFGEADRFIPLDDVEKIRAAHPDIPLHLYPAGHGFNCDRRSDYHEPSARLARERTMAFLARQLG